MIFFSFFQKVGADIRACKMSPKEIIRMKCQTLFPDKKKSKFCLLKFYTAWWALSMGKFLKLEFSFYLFYLIWNIETKYTDTNCLSHLFTNPLKSLGYVRLFYYTTTSVLTFLFKGYKFTFRVVNWQKCFIPLWNCVYSARKDLHTEKANSFIIE